ncbi:MAG: phospholipase effector Tle1 domain-containing protein [Methylobacter sp.]
MALDEQRRAFAPSLWEQADNVDQVVFPGAHADVGGGYPLANNESGLSDITLQWMAKHLQDAGVRFTTPICQGFHPDPLGTAHQPWRHPPFNLPGSLQPRDFTKAWVTTGHPSINERMGKLVIHEPNTSPIPYAPKNWP